MLWRWTGGLFLIAVAVWLAVASPPPPVARGQPPPGESIPLAAGWNLISLPLIPTNADPSQLFASIADKLETAYAFDASGAAWLSYSPAAPPFLNSLKAVDVKMGLWLLMKEAADLSLQGTPPGATTIALAQDWNLIGWPGTATPVETALAAIVDKVEVVWNFGSSWRSYTPGFPLNTLTQMEPKKGYWVRMKATGSLVVGGGPPGFALTVDKFGDGVITSSPEGIKCGSNCTAQTATFPPGTTVVLTATPEAGSVFSYWSGCDSVSSNSCSVN